MSKLLSECTTEDAFVTGVKKNIALTKLLIEEGKTPGTLAIVSGSESAKNLWQKILDGAKSSLKALSVFSLHEDLPVNQAFGVLLLWQRHPLHALYGNGQRPKARHCDACARRV